MSRNHGVLWCAVMGTGFFLTGFVDAREPKPKATLGDRMMRSYLSAETEKIEAEFLPMVRSRVDFESMRGRLKREYMDMLGLWPVPSKTPLHAVTTGTLDQGDYQVENMHFQSIPGLYVTGNLYRPARFNSGEKLPAVLYVCGHSTRGRNGNKTAFQDHGIWFAQHGYVCLIIDTLQMGEIAAIHHGTYSEQRWWWHSRGYTSAGVECWNGVRALDYLAARPDVDVQRIAVTGISGGGAATFWIAAADDRVRVAVPVSGMADLQSYVTDKVVDGHCDCMFLYNTYRWHWSTIAALLCPRPMLFMNSNNDAIFPMDANERVINRLERLYAFYGAGDRVDSVVSIGGHAYRKDLRASVFRFINTYLHSDSSEVRDSESGLAPDGSENPRIVLERLRVFPGDNDIPADQINTRVDELFVPRADVTLPGRGEYESWKRSLLKKLKQYTFRDWPNIAGLEPVRSFQDGWTLESTEQHIWTASKPMRDRGTDKLWMWVLNPEDADAAEIPAWAEPAIGDEDVLLFAPRGVGPTAWERRNPPNTVERSLALIGRTVDTGRVLDVCVAVARRARESGKQIGLMGRAEAGIVAAYAALLMPKVHSVVVSDPPSTHLPSPRFPEGGPHLLNVTRVLDIPEALGMLAPRKLILLGGDSVFQRTHKIYQLSGFADSLDWSP